jgi:hypothetical protein
MPRICTVESSCADAVRIRVNHPSDVRGRKRFTLSRRGFNVGGTISIDLTLGFWQFSDMKRLLVEIVIIAALIALSWTTPFKDSTAQAYRNITNWFDSLAR